jgi:hypothetical protein
VPEARDEPNETGEILASAGCGGTDGMQHPRCRYQEIEKESCGSSRCSGL